MMCGLTGHHLPNVSLKFNLSGVEERTCSDTSALRHLTFFRVALSRRDDVREVRQPESWFHKFR